jgi:hypothetical protein
VRQCVEPPEERRFLRELARRITFEGAVAAGFV